MNVLNKVEPKPAPTDDAGRISQELQQFMLKLKGKFMTEDGSSVNYTDMKQSKVFEEYNMEAKKLNKVNLASLSSSAEKLAFFINVYNALTIHGLASCDVVPKSVLDIKQFFMTTAYDIGGYTFSLDDIEHGILRDNRGHAATRKPQFAADDARLKFVEHAVDPRIHFALNCGAKSCPAIRVYTATNLDRALTEATKTYLEAEIITLPKCGEMYLPRLLQWYRQDFGRTDVDGVKWCLPYLSEEKQKTVDLLLIGLEQVGQVDLNYNEYNWDLNTVM